MIGIRLKEERQRLGLTQPDFAKVADASKRTLIDWEKGVSAPNGFQLSALALIGADIQYIVTGQRSSAVLPSEEAFMLEKIRQADAATRNKILMLLLGAQDATGAVVNNQGGINNGVQVGHNSGKIFSKD
ncbi:helix-turn-helix domain-containing protein [Acinetobacter sp. WCHAc060025]|uniref:helix-turn-helix domain-containing protein n=1 Tax=Acinetobacter sp. WCHAc060025 TaxID=2518625 RepID=UPI0010232F69|nr:helix-turn-helix domain-containing protein [Acinetobacter sp. WCHAc060025]RZG77761.1 helix-turn-helix domain-containing protein [Acinetobacter sp. WCHAc060025]